MRARLFDVTALILTATVKGGGLGLAEIRLLATAGLIVFWPLSQIVILTSWSDAKYGRGGGRVRMWLEKGLGGPE